MRALLLFCHIVLLLFSLFSIELKAQDSYLKELPVINTTCGDIGVENGWSSWIATTGNYSSGNVSINATVTPTSPCFNITSGNGMDFCAPIPVVCPGFGNHSIQLGQIKANGNAGGCAGGCVEQLTFPLMVTPSDTNFTFAYAIVMDSTNHVPNEKPFVEIVIKDLNGNVIPCGQFTYTLNPPSPDVLQSSCSSYYKPWTIVGVNLSAYVGQMVKVTITNADCGLGDHYAYSYWDFACNGGLFPSNSCFICAPSDPSINYSYQWIHKGNIYGNTQCITSIPGDTFFVNISRPFPPTCPFQLSYISQGTCPNLLTGSVFKDANANCVMNIGDTPFPNRYVQIQDSATNIKMYATTDNNGNYSMPVPAGTFSVSSIWTKPYWQQVCPPSGSYTASVNMQDTISNLNFGEDIAVYCPDLFASVGSGTIVKCKKNNYWVKCGNDGTIAANNILLTMNFDSRMVVLGSSVPWDSVSGTNYYWKINSLQPGQNISFSIHDSISCNTQVGDTLHVSAVITPFAGDCDLSNNMEEENHIVYAPVDPNIKEAITTSNKIYIKQANILPTDTINYTIHFQNTGNDTAYDVIIYDTLDSHLNPASVISGASSHPYKFELTGTGILKWTFNNILLPDSTTNVLASEGFIKYRILQKPNNPNGAVIKNSAGIVFDFNAPVITDTVVLTVKIPTAIEENKLNKLSFIISPNPSSAKFWIRAETEIKKLEVYNVYGERIYSSFINSNKTEIDLSNQSEGIYFLQIKTVEGAATKKIILQR